MAERQQNPAAIVNSELGIAKVFHKIDAADADQIDFNQANSMQDIGRKLLQSIGFSEPDDVSIQAAVELNDTLIDGLQAIHKRAQDLTLERE